MRSADLEAGIREYLVAATLDTGFRNIDVYRTLEKVWKSKRGVREMHGVFRKHLNSEGHRYASDLCDRIIGG